MKITKDAEWQRLEGKVGQLRGDLRAAESKLKDHAAATVAKQLGLVAGATVLIYKGERFIFTRCEGAEYSPFPYGRKFRKDGKPADREQCLYMDWQIER